MRAAAALGVGLMAVAPVIASGCGDSYAAVFDSLPIALVPHPPIGSGPMGDGALLAMASPADAAGQAFRMLISTGSPETLLDGPAPSGKPQTSKAAFDLLDGPAAIADPSTAAVRGQFRGVSVLRLPLFPAGDPSVTLGGLLGGDILRRYSVDFRFGAACADATTANLCPSMTIWSHLGPDLGFLQDSGYAVIRFSLAGGGEVTADGDPDFLGQRGPLVLSPTRIVMRTCAVPKAVSPDPAITPIVACCTQKNAESAALRSGIDLALVLDTGVGPLVLSDAAWRRIVPLLGTPPVTTDADLLIATWPDPIPAKWSTIPKYALVDLESEPATDPGPCVELARARRLEQVAFQVDQDARNQVATTACTQRCDADPREPDKAQNSAAYLELTGAIPVAVIPDDHPYLQGLRFDIRPEGPEVDGVIGAGALGRSRVEIDYVSSPAKAVFSCESGTTREECFASARCPRLPDANSGDHLCFGLPRQGFVPVCATSLSGC